MRAYILTILVALFATVATALPLQPGDVIVVVETNHIGPDPSTATFTDEVRVYSPTGVFKQTLLSRDAFLAPIALSPVSTLLIADSGVIRRFAASGQALPDFTDHTTALRALVFDRAGNLYAASAFGSTLLSYNPDGVYRDTLDVSGFAPNFGSIDLAGDQCTMYGTGTGYLSKLDVCQHSFLSNIALPIPSSAFRILPDGSILMSGPQLTVLSGTGQTLRTFSVSAEWVALDPGGTAAWINNGGVVTKLDLGTGTPLLSFDTGRPHINAILIVGEPRAALAAVGVPLMTNWILAAFVLGLTGVALWRLRAI